MLENLSTTQRELLAYAARLVTEEGLDYGQAKRAALNDLKLPSNTRIPDNDALEWAIREHIEIFLAETQPAELQRLREIALTWMERLKEFNPFISGTVWHGLATRQSDIRLQLFCEDPKMAEIFLINNRVRYTTSTTQKPNGSLVTTLTVQHPAPEWGQYILIHITLNEYDDIRGTLKPDAQGRPPQGNLPALQSLLESANTR